MTDLTAVAMSGGLDSSVVAWLLARAGRPVVGLSMLLWDRSEESAHGRTAVPGDLDGAIEVAQPGAQVAGAARLGRALDESLVERPSQRRFEPVARSRRQLVQQP